MVERTDEVLLEKNELAVRPDHVWYAIMFTTADGTAKALVLFSEVLHLDNVVTLRRRCFV